MIGSVSGVGRFAPTTVRRSPQEILNERSKEIRRERMEKLYDNLEAKKENKEKMTDVQLMQLYFMKAMKIAEKLGDKPVVY